jgi:hypothetical protein
MGKKEFTVEVFRLKVDCCAVLCEEGLMSNRRPSSQGQKFGATATNASGGIVSIGNYRLSTTLGIGSFGKVKRTNDYRERTIASFLRDYVNVTPLSFCQWLSTLSRVIKLRGLIAHHTHKSPHIERWFLSLL